ncbi:hypothetical protein [Sphingorhabdus sp. SMR4y]|uniref:hypothetical protein n=1 Tax=Sphingorhabdus sp. SMR4y TaxID=2584094 RepID=UPI000B5C8195|nr:hypothetical protein [Sphingorhabdus sp. SMR4y]ASK89834.1 hypothetical protein SPHFLASMR4Y_03102 [Sphingorhabdus sp. SMR4y]
MNKALKIIMWIVIANIAVIPLILLLNGTGAVPDSTASPEDVNAAQIDDAAPVQRPVNLGDPAALAAYRAENDKLIGALDRDLDHIIGADKKSFVVERQAGGSGCDIELVAQTPDESLVRYAPFPVLAIVGMDGAIRDGDGPMNSHVLRIMIDQRKTANPDVPTVMVSMPLETEPSKRLSQLPYFDMPHESATERDRIKRRLAEIMERCSDIAEAEAKI